MGAGGDVGGDTSVEWRFWGDNVRLSSINSCGFGEHGFEQGAVDETDDGQQFTVSLKIPKEPAEFIRTLREAADNAAKYAGQPGYLVSFVMPIERSNPNQIQIRWESAGVDGKSVARYARTKRAVRKPQAAKRRSTPKRRR